MNFILSKNEAVEDGGCFLSKISIGNGTVWHNWLFRQTGFSQHSGSSQSIKPSEKKANKSQLLTLRLNPARYYTIFFIPLTSHQNIHSRIGISKNNAKEHICFNQILMLKKVQAKLTIISFFLNGNVFFMKLKIQLRGLFYGYLLLPIFSECIRCLLVKCTHISLN